MTLADKILGWWLDVGFTIVQDEYDRYAAYSTKGNRVSGWKSDKIHAVKDAYKAFNHDRK